MSEYTKGPWVADECGSIETTTRVKSRFVATTVYMTSEFRGEKGANARLIAAAPELLEALKEMVFIYADQERGYDYFLGRHIPTALKAAKEAIAKAEGR